MAKYTIIGKPYPRIDGRAKVTGQARYVGDMIPANVLRGKLLRSPYPHAHILNIDATRALRLAGVKAVVTTADGPGKMYGQIPWWADEHIPALHKVRYVGEAVAAVAAVDEDIAEEAVRLIDVEYEPLPAVFDPEEAMQEGAPQLHDTVKNNVSIERHWHLGDVEKGFAESDYVREDRFETQAVTHAPMEPHTVLAEWEPGGKLTVWASTQSATVHRHNLAYALGLHDSDVRVIQPHVGGGFGGKMELYAIDVCAALLSRKTGRPVFFAISREEELTLTRERHPTRYTLKTGVKRDGTLVARQLSLVVDGGAHRSLGAQTLFLMGASVALPYRLPNYRYDVRRAYTNKTPSGAYRGHGQPQICFGAEQQIEMIAQDLGLDPAEMRLRNALHGGDVAVNDFHVSSCGLTEAIQTAVSVTDWTEKRAQGRGSRFESRGSRVESREDGGTNPQHPTPDTRHPTPSIQHPTPNPRPRGIGMACDSFGSGSNFSPHLIPTVFIKIHYDGTIALLTGASDIGQGALTVCAMIAAEELGVEVGDIQVTAADTEITPLDSGSYSSRVTVAVGNAAKAAAVEARKQIFEAVAEKLEVSPDDLQAAHRRISVKGSPEKGVSYQQAIRMCFDTDRLPILVKGGWKAPVSRANHETGVGNMSHTYTFCAQTAEVEVDRETGEVTLLRMTAAHDCGYAINPLAADGQVEGSIMGAVGQALHENLEREQGHTLQSSFLEYRIPTALEAPAMAIHMIETVDPFGPYGAKEAGESLQLGSAPAIANAIYDAIGVRIHSMPITPEKVLHALQEKERAEKPTR